MSDKHKFILDESDIPKAFYNVVPDALAAGVEIPPPLHPGTHKPLTPEDLAPIFPMGLIAQEASVEREIEIPDPVRELFKIYRPTPLIRARRLEQILDTPAHIYYKYEGVSPAGSHKLNTAIAQAFYNHEEGVRKISTETGAGQWGSSMAMACGFFDMECQVYMVKVSFNQKPYRRILMETFGARVTPSPSMETEAGRRILAEHPTSHGSLGIAISEAVEVAAKSGGKIKYGLGSVLNHVLLHQTVVGQEAKKQMELAGEAPDYVVGCVGGGSNFAGLAFPFMADRSARTRYVAVEPTATPSFTKGAYAYDFGDTGKLTPLVKMFTLGHTFMPAGIHAGGLRYHGMAPLLCALYAGGWLEAVACSQNPVFAAAVQFARAEGIIPAPESAHAVRSAIDLAIEAKERGEKRTILFNLSGHGHFDLTSYERYLDGDLEDYAYPAEEVQAALAHLPKVD